MFPFIRIDQLFDFEESLFFGPTINTSDMPLSEPQFTLEEVDLYIADNDMAHCGHHTHRPN